jgi:cell wall-associated NlpC family hydrolase
MRPEPAASLQARRPEPVQARRAPTRSLDGADGARMPRVIVRSALVLVLLACASPASTSAQTTGGTQYGAASQAPAPAPAPAPGGTDPSQPLPDPENTPAPPAAPRTAPAPRPGQVARVLPSGLAVAPAGAPPEVRLIIQAGNRIARAPYVWGGGHARWEDRGYDCSGSVSYALRGAGLLLAPLVSGGLARWGDPGPGQWVTVYANAGHVYLVVAGLRFDTSGRKRAGTRWQAAPRPARGFRVRHPAGL